MSEQMHSKQNNSVAADGTALHCESRMTPDGDWVWRWVGPWNLDEDAVAGRSIVENDAIQQESRS